jgi:hypothetical protein
MFFRVATLIAAAIATAAIGSESPANAQPAITEPKSPVISADHQCGDGMEWSKKLLAAAYPYGQLHPRHRRGQPFFVSMGTTPTPKPPRVHAPDTAVFRHEWVSRPQ